MSDRIFSVVRRRPHVVDLYTDRRPAGPTQDGYRILVAPNFDTTAFSAIIDAGLLGYLDPNVNQATLDVQSSTDKTRIVFDPSSYAQTIAGQTGAAASVSAFGAGVATISGLTGMTAASVGHYLTISGADTAGNNGTFLIVTFNSATSVDVENPDGGSPDANDGSIAWSEELSILDDDKSFWMQLQPLAAGSPLGDPTAPTLVLPDSLRHGLITIAISGTAPATELRLDFPLLMENMNIVNLDDTNNLLVGSEEGGPKNAILTENDQYFGFNGAVGSIYIQGDSAPVAFTANFTLCFPR